MKKKGITLVELAVVVFLIVLFSAILVSDFPKIKRSYALSAAAYGLAQNLRKVESMGASGVGTPDSLGNLLPVKGYGVFVDLNQSAGSQTKYILYADLPNLAGNYNQKYDGDFSTTPYCENLACPTCYYDSSCNPPTASPCFSDCVLEIVDISKQDPNLLFTLNNIAGNTISINFSPPNPAVSISPGPVSGSCRRN